MASFNPDDWKKEYAEGDDVTKVRLIGIEFEGKVKTPAKIKDEYKFMNRKYLEQQGIGKRTESNGHIWYDQIEIDDFQKEKLDELGIVYGGIGYDGGGREIVSCPDSFTLFQQGGSERLKNLVKLWAESTEADPMSGTHFHVSKLDGDVKTTWNNIYWMCMVFGPQLQKIFGRRSSWANIPLPKNYFTSNFGSDYLFEVPQKQPKRSEMQRDGYNKHSMVVHRGDRYEFRAGKASHDLDEILAWAEICHSIVEICSRGYIQEIPFSDLLQGPFTRKYIAKLNRESEERKITPKERTMKISSAGYVLVQSENKIFN